MSVAGFKRSMPILLKSEGGKVDNPKDPGGRTNQGVIQRVYDGWRRRKKLPTRDVYKMDPKERDAIYKAQYWDEIKGDLLPDGVDYVVFDGAANSGPGQSVKWLQRALQPRYAAEIDGQMGAATLSALDQHPNHDELIKEIINRRMAFLRALRTWPTFGKGWTSRLKDVKAVGQAWATGEATPAITFSAAGAPKASVEDAKSIPTKAPGDIATGGGIVATTLTQTTDQLAPLAYDSHWIATIVAILTIVGVLAVVGGLLYRWYAKKREAERADALDLPVKRKAAVA